MVSFRYLNYGILGFGIKCLTKIYFDRSNIKVVFVYNLNLVAKYDWWVVDWYISNFGLQIYSSIVSQKDFSCNLISMTTTLDMSLDDMIKSKRGNRERNREGGRGPRGRGRGRGPRGSFIAGRMTGGIRRGPPTMNARPSAHTIAKAS